MERLTGEIKRAKTDRVKRGRWWGCSREIDGPMWRDKRERVGSRWILSTNLKECSWKKAAGFMHVPEGVEGGG